MAKKAPSTEPEKSVPFAELEKQYQLRKTLIDQARAIRDQKAREYHDADAKLKSLIEGRFSPLQIAALMSHASRKQNSVARVVDNRGKFERVAKTAQGDKKPSTVGKRARAMKNSQPVKEMVFEVLSERGEMDVPEIARAVLDRGYKTSSKFITFCQSVVSQLTRDDRFRRVSVGRYTVASNRTPSSIPVPDSAVPQM